MQKKILKKGKKDEYQITKIKPQRFKKIIKG